MSHIRNHSRPIKNFGFIFLFLISGLGACRSGIETVDGEDGGSTGGGGGGSTGGGGDGTGSISPDPPGVVNDKAGFYVQVVDGEKIKFYERRLVKNAPTDFSKECVITNASDSANNDIECIVDIPEEDLHFHGLSLQHNFPSDMCSYVTLEKYYYRFKDMDPDDMNVTITYTKDKGGRIAPGTALANFPITLPSTCATSITSENDCKVTAAAVEHLSNGSPKCKWDYSASPGQPNCCEGSYTVNAYEWVPDTTTTTSGQFVLNQSTGNWTGKKANCFKGPAFDVADAAIAENGFPEVPMFYVEGAGLNQKIVLPSPISKKTNTRYLSNFYKSLFTNTPTMPEPLVADGYSSPTYQYTCFDRAGEVNARIRLYIQEWNSLNAFINSKTVVSNPMPADIVGTETGPGGGQINDFSDWDDLFP